MGPSSPEEQRRQMPPPQFFPQQALMAEPSIYPEQLLEQTTTSISDLAPASSSFPSHTTSSGASLSLPTTTSWTSIGSMSADPLQFWYGSTNNDPWTPHKSNAAPMQVFSANPYTRPRTTIASDTESIITTHTTPGTSYSVYSGDESIVGIQDSVPIQDGFANMNVNRRRSTGRSVSALGMPTAKVSKARPSSLRCLHCNVEMKTASEAKKHRLKHEKPFKCHAEDCDRLEGFTTANDLERHKKSRHRIFNGPVKCYKCISDSCIDKAKIWTRLDNFNQHLDRMHPGENRDEMVKRSVYMHYPEDNGTAPPNEDYDDYIDFTTPSTHDAFGFMGNQFSTQDDSIFDQSLQIDPTLDLQLSPAQPSYGALLPPPTDPTWPSPQSVASSGQFLPHNSAQRSASYMETFPAGQPTLVLHPSESPAGVSQAETLIEKAVSQGYDPNSLAAAIHRHLHGEHPRSNSLPNPPPPVNLFGPNGCSYLSIPQQPPRGSATPRRMSMATPSTTFNSSSLAPPPTSQPQPTNSNIRRGREVKRFKCKYCEKVTDKQSALKKHQKRHERLYGCTFNICTKIFGSKDDWKRHENSQHFQVDTWQCGESQKVVSYDGATEKVCAKLFHRREIFAEHLKRTHHMVDKAAIAERCTANHVASNSQTAFWCGFCCSIQQLGSKGWDERFNHIGDHFTEGRTVSEWVPEGLDELHESAEASRQQIDKSNHVGEYNQDEDDEDAEGTDDDSTIESATNSTSVYNAPILADAMDTPLLQARMRSSSNAKRQRMDPQMQMAPIAQMHLPTSSTRPSISFGTAGVSGVHGSFDGSASGSFVDEEIYCCQCSNTNNGPFETSPNHFRCNCTHILCDDCFRGVRKRARSYSGQRHAS